MRTDGVKSLEETKLALDDKEDLAETADPGTIPADTDIQEGDEENEDGPDLPPAMPPGA
jgi:hypothetical protein